MMGFIGDLIQIQFAPDPIMTFYKNKIDQKKITKGWHRRKLFGIYWGPFQ